MKLPLLCGHGDRGERRSHVLVSVARNIAPRFQLWQKSKSRARLGRAIYRFIFFSEVSARLFPAIRCGAAVRWRGLKTFVRRAGCVSALCFRIRATNIRRLASPLALHRCSATNRNCLVGYGKLPDPPGSKLATAHPMCLLLLLLATVRQLRRTWAGDDTCCALSDS